MLGGFRGSASASLPEKIAAPAALGATSAQITPGTRIAALRVNHVPRRELRTGGILAHALQPET